jgi:hypothetical protein
VQILNFRKMRVIDFLYWRGRADRSAKVPLRLPSATKITEPKPEPRAHKRTLSIGKTLVAVARRARLDQCFPVASAAGPVPAPFAGGATNVPPELNQVLIRQLTFLILTCFAVLTSTSRAQADTSVSREALFRRAFSSTAYIMAIAHQDERFQQSLTPVEKKMFEGILAISQEARNHEWAKQNGIYRTAQGASAYVFHGNYFQPEERPVLIDYPVTAELIFSADQSHFKVRPDEPLRTATTEDALDKPIYVNTEIINQPKLSLGFSDVVQILIHEFGHKLGPQAKVQASVDSMAAKMKAFIDSHTTSFRLSNGSAKVIRFQESVYADWHETTLTGRYIGVNIPNTLERFRAISDEGLYVFLEGQTGFTDITTELLRDLAQDAKFEPYKGLSYSWKHFRHYSPKAVSVREFQPGKIRIEVDGQQAQTAIPFLVEGDEDPVTYRPWARIEQKSELGLYSNQRFEWTIDTAEKRKLSVWSKALIFEDASTQAQFVSSQTAGSDLVFTYKIPLQVAVKGTGKTQVRPYLVVQIGNDIVEIEGQRSQNDPALTSFRLKNAQTLIRGSVKPLNIEVEPVTRNLALPYYVRTRLFLDKSEAVQLTGQTAAKPPRLKQQTMGNGKLFLTFESHTELLGLKLQVEIQRSKTTVSKTTMGTESKVMGQGTMKLPASAVTLSLPAEALQQDLKQGVLHVAVDLSTGIETKHFTIDDLTPGDLPGPARGLKMTEEVTTQVTGEPKVLAIEATTQSGLLMRVTTGQQPQSSRIANSCRDLF